MEIISIHWDQYDQILEQKVAQMFPKVASKVATAVFTYEWGFLKLPNMFQSFVLFVL